MAENYIPTPEENVSVFRIPRTAGVIASLALAVGGVSACAHEKHCEVVGTHTMLQGETVWGTVDDAIPEDDKDNSYDVRERMDWVKQVNPDMKTIGNVQAGDTVNIPGNCK